MTATTTPAERLILTLAAHLCERPEMVRAVERHNSILLMTAHASDQRRLIGAKGQNINALSDICEFLGMDKVRLVEPVRPDQLVGEKACHITLLGTTCLEVFEAIGEALGREIRVELHSFNDAIDLEVSASFPPAVQLALVHLLRAVARKTMANMNPDFELSITWT